MKKNLYFITLLVSISAIVCLLGACTGTKQLAYFNTIQHDSTATIQKQYLETVISKNDILQITISTLDESINRQLNSPNIVGATGAATNGYLVDESGVIKLPFIGVIKAEGLTKKQLSDLITKELLERKLAKEPIVTVRIENYKVTIWGEVARPGNIPVPNEKITLPEALASAGDLTVYGRRDNILLIREKDGKRIYKHIDLNQGQIFDPEIYNLQNQDIIYVSPTKNRAAAIDRSPQTLSLVISAISIIIIIYTQFIK